MTILNANEYKQVKMEDTEASWIFDSLLCFLHGPVWNAPLQSFIEEKSLIFEPDPKADNSDFKSIYDDFRNLVDLMLSCYMEDIGITTRQFEDACNRERQLIASSEFDQNLFELIWAANDYELFKRMMAQRNVELQLEALELIEQKYGITPESFIPNKTKAGGGVQTIKRLKEAPELERQVREEINKKFAKEKPDSSDVAAPNEIKKFVESTEEVASTSTEKLEKNYFNKTPASTDIDRAELQKRQEYLRAQRDKLVALKKEARKKQLGASEAATRPKSARAAEAVMAGSGEGAELQQRQQQQQLQVRKALAERLRAEVADEGQE